ncbi:UNVERIFIED_CONTAM: Periplasmic protease [Acetivibrio alkalicellulosi]
MSNIRNVKWREDLDQLQLELPKRHRNLFFHLDKRKFNEKIENLKTKIDNYNVYEICASIAEIVASARDAHTSLAIPVINFIPIEWYYFNEGLYIIDAYYEYSNLVNKEVVFLNGISIEEVKKRVSCIISYENESYLKAQIPRYLKSAEVLKGIGIIDDVNEVKLTLKNHNNEFEEVRVKTYDYSELKDQESKVKNSTDEDIPLFRRNPHKKYWSYYIKDYNTLYFKYDSCSNMEDISVEKSGEELLEFIIKENVSKLVIDIRSNLGGNSTLLEPFIRELKKLKKLNIYLVVGRETFSSALINAYSIKNNTNAIVVGEATGGKPNSYGEVKAFSLGNSKLIIRYSSQYYKLVKSDKLMSLEPDVKFNVSFKDYYNKIDPCMEYIVNTE